MMEDTPSNYNIANGRLEGKSMGLKAILLFAKNQGIQLGAANPPPVRPGMGAGSLPQIKEENPTAVTPNDLASRNALNRNSVMQSSGEANQWKAMNAPMNTSAVGRSRPH